MCFPPKEFFSSSCLSFYQEARLHETPPLHEPIGDLAEKWTELEWQALWYSGAFGTTSRLFPYESVLLRPFCA